jgi:hypothetical protein
MILPIIIMIVISAIFVRGIIRYSKNNHNCNRHQMYFEDETSRGLVCGVCYTDISIEYYPTTKGA